MFAAVEADPSRATLETAAVAARAAVAASVVGFGGASPMDVAKPVAKVFRVISFQRFVDGCGEFFSIVLKRDLVVG